MKHVKLIYFEGCPKLENVKEILKSIPSVVTEEVLQDELPLNHPLRAYSSPTVLLGDLVIYGTPIGTTQGCCSIEEADENRMRQRLSE
jgi:hypothetical protein